MFDTIKLFLNQFSEGIMSVFNWKPTESIFYGPIIGLIAVLCKLLGIILGVSFITFFTTYSSYIVISKTYALLF